VASLNVTVDAVADAPTLTADDASGNEDTAIALDIAAALVDVDGSETLSDVTITGVPSGALLSAGTNNGNGTWSVAVADLPGLTITPPADSDTDFTLGVSVTSTEAANGDTATSVASIDVTVNAVADTPTLTGQDTWGTFLTPIPLDITTALVDLDGSESLSAVTISGVPLGSVLSAGVNNGNGTWSVDVADLNGLTITPPADFYGELVLDIAITSTEARGADAATASTQLLITVDPIPAALPDPQTPSSDDPAEDTTAPNALQPAPPRTESDAPAEWDGSEELTILDPDPSADPLIAGPPAISSVEHVLDELEDIVDELTLDLFEEIEADSPEPPLGLSRFDATDKFADAFELIGRITETVESADSDGETDESDPDRWQPPDPGQTHDADPSASSSPAVKSAAWFWAATRAALGVLRRSE